MTDRERDATLVDILTRLKRLELAVNGIAQEVHAIRKAKWFDQIKHAIAAIKAKTDRLKG